MEALHTLTPSGLLKSLGLETTPAGYDCVGVQFTVERDPTDPGAFLKTIHARFKPADGRAGVLVRQYVGRGRAWVQQHGD